MNRPLSRVRLPVETPRLRLSLPSRRDIPDLERCFRDPRTAHAVGAPLHSRAEMRDPGRIVARTLREYRAGEHLSLSVVLREDDSCIGRVGLRGLDWTWRKVESLAYWIEPGRWNQGYATESAWFLCREAFRRLGMRRISSSALEDNRASLSVLRRLGFVEEGRERQSVRLGGRNMDMILFGLLKEELVPWTTRPRREVVPTRRS